MDSAVDTEGGKQFGETLPVSMGEKRPLENGEGGGLEREEAQLNKRPRIGGLKRVAEIVLVLSTMASIRGGKKPTEVEVGLMSEARTKLVELCEGLAPKDIVARDAIEAVVEDLGLNAKAKDQKLGFRGPRLTIAERFSQTKRKMEESRTYAGQSSPYTSHSLQTSFNTGAESRGSPHTLRMIPSDKQTYLPVSSVAAPASLPIGHVSTATSASMSYQLPTSDVRAPTVSSGFISNNLGRDSPSLALPRIERPQFKLDGPNVPSLASQGQGNIVCYLLTVNASSNHHLVNAPTRSVQTQATKSGPEQSKLPIPTLVKVEGTGQMNVQRLTTSALRDQNFRPLISQPASANLPTMPQPLQASNFVQAASLSNSHNEIAKTVQKLLQPKLPDHPTWIPPSRDYMTKALQCQICMVTIHEVDNVLICDACEKGYHTKCAQSFNLRVIPIPRGEWHCSRCLALSNGKPLPPKYGRVMRSNTPAKISSSTAGAQSSSEKKVENANVKASQQIVTANGSSDLQTPTHTDVMALGNNSVDSAADPNPKETQTYNLSSISMDTKPVLGSCATVSMKSVEDTCGSSAVASSESSSQLLKDSEPPNHQENSLEVKTQPLNHASDTFGDNMVDPSQSSLDSCVVEQADQTNSAEVALKKSQENNEMLKETDKSHLIESTLSYDKRVEHDGAQENTVGWSATSSEVTEHSGNSFDDLRSVEWVGNVIQNVDEKLFYQTCCVDGVTYKLQDHALFRSSHGKLIPSKLKAREHQIFLLKFYQQFDLEIFELITMLDELLMLSMWEDSKTGSKWVIVNRCYFPGDLPENVGRPCTTDSNEVYDSNHDSTIMAGLINGPCEVLPLTKFKDENERRSQLNADSNSRLHPIFICKWFYDEFKGSFQPVSG
ncbi:hypothetical protein F8388_020699 [Cannabis sativa]|uniref:PHD finger protein n=1 Tax=Cannabis sativa TaxID=3483 RepID=A0A7J6G504_CANSA|nr:hypothetical protein F8388_020699 [Cannabis sativa]